MRVVVMGNHYPYKDKLKELGFVWDSIRRDWILLELNPKDKNKLDKVLKEMKGIKIVYE